MAQPKLEPAIAPNIPPIEKQENITAIRVITFAALILNT